MTQEIEIILIEDNPDDAALAIRALRRKNLANKLIHLRDGQEALEFFFTPEGKARETYLHSPRVILLDLNMPMVSGLEVLEKLKADPLLSKIPVIVLTSSSADPGIRRCRDLGANHYIIKPVDFRNFAETVAALGMHWVILNSR